MIMISRPIGGTDGGEYLLDEFGKLLEFETVKDAIQFFAERNFTITDLLDFDFHFEELEESPYLLTTRECEEAIAAYQRRR